MTIAGWIALTVAALIVFALANYFPIVTLRLMSQTVNASLPQALVLTWPPGSQGVALMTGMYGFVVPLAPALFRLWGLLAVSSVRLPSAFSVYLLVLRTIEVLRN